MGQCFGKEEKRTAAEIGLPEDRFVVVKKLGRGSEGELWLMKDKTRDRADQLVAVKMIPRGPGLDEERMLREIILQSSLTHIHIVKVFQIILTDAYFCIVMEYAKGGDLFTFITKKMKYLDQYQVMSEDMARYFFRQIILAVYYCHQRQIAHRDLKLANVLLDDSKPPRVKLCDFGLSRSYDYELLNCYTVVGTPAYMSPEVLAKDREEGYDPVKADVWSVGVLLYAMLRGRFPFHSENGNLKTVLYNINLAHRGDPSHLWANAWSKADLSEEVKDLVDRCLDMDSERRITIEEIMHHPWFVKLPEEPFRSCQAFNEEAQRNWNKVVCRISSEREERLQKIVHEALIGHGHPGEILEWHPPHSIRIRTEKSHADLAGMYQAELNRIGGAGM